MFHSPLLLNTPHTVLDKEQFVVSFDDNKYYMIISNFSIILHQLLAHCPLF